MRIKKISQSAAIPGKIVNSPSDSTTETYSCNYINKKYSNLDSKGIVHNKKTLDSILEGTTTTETDVNNITAIGSYRIGSSTKTNLPASLTSGNGILIVLHSGVSTDVIYQIYADYNGETYSRIYWYNSWTSWKKLT